jgi:hypothetical protein
LEVEVRWSEKGKEVEGGMEKWGEEGGMEKWGEEGVERVGVRGRWRNGEVG